MSDETTRVQRLIAAAFALLVAAAAPVLALAQGTSPGGTGSGGPSGAGAPAGGGSGAGGGSPAGGGGGGGGAIWVIVILAIILAIWLFSRGRRRGAQSR